jgi:hypothetical protein
VYENVKAKQTAAVCKEWTSNTFKAGMMNKGLGMVINIINFVLRTVMIKLVTEIKEDTKTE